MPLNGDVEFAVDEESEISKLVIFIPAIINGSAFVIVGSVGIARSGSVGPSKLGVNIVGESSCIDKLSYAVGNPVGFVPGGPGGPGGGHVDFHVVYMLLKNKINEYITS